MLLRPERRGHLELASADPLTSPRIIRNYLATEHDRAVLRHSAAVVYLGIGRIGDFEKPTRRGFRLGVGSILDELHGLLMRSAYDREQLPDACRSSASRLGRAAYRPGPEDRSKCVDFIDPQSGRTSAPR